MLKERSAHVAYDRSLSCERTFSHELARYP
jgi:hypothetical protein